MRPEGSFQVLPKIGAIDRAPAFFAEVKMPPIKITETILRDAHQSLLATRMRTRDMLPVADKLDAVGFWSLEVWGGATFDSAIRFLNEDPWERLRQLKSAIKKTPLQMLLRGQNLVGYRHYADDVVEKFIQLSVKNGVDIFRIFDALNDIRNLEKSIEFCRRYDVHIQWAICYSISPVHTVERYVKMAKELEQLGCHSICIKDMAGMISPPVTKELVTALKEAISLPIDLHSHCTSGLAPMSYQVACEAGVSILDTAISSLGGGTSQPPTESIVAALQGTEWDTGLDLKLLMEIKKYFDGVREKYLGVLDPISERVDADVLLHQIPGGMISNLINQLKEQNALDRYDEVLQELPRVRAEMGYPPLVTPTSQVVGTQAVFNVLVGERYKVVSQEVKDYFKGLYGRPPGDLDEQIKRVVIPDEEPINCRPADLIPPALGVMKAEMKEKGLQTSDEDLVTYALYPMVALKFLRGEIEEEELKPAPPRAGMELPEPEPPVSVRPTHFEVEVDGETFSVRVTPTGHIEVGGPVYAEGAPVAKPKPPAGPIAGGIFAPMQGMIVKLKVAVGDKVEKGTVVAILEAMKMQNSVIAHEAGTVEEIFVSEGQIVGANEAIMRIGS